MPFTLAHPAIVLPLRRTALVFSALVVGSLTPDFPYFVLTSNDMHWGHTIPGIFLFCLPSGLAVLWLFHVLMKRPLVALAPEIARKRIAPSDLEFQFGPWNRLAWIAGSVLLGAISHIFWDGFTHDHGYFVKHWALLSTPVETYRVMPLWRALQQGCSVVGVAVVILVTAWWWYRKPVLSEPVASQMTPRLRWFVIAIMTLIACMTGAAAGYGVHFGHQWKMSLIKGVVVAISTLCAEVFVFSLAWFWGGPQPKSEKPLDREIQRLEPTTQR